jgi:hypothetical protein
VVIGVIDGNEVADERIITDLNSTVGNHTGTAVDKDAVSDIKVSAR